MSHRHRPGHPSPLPAQNHRKEASPWTPCLLPSSICASAWPSSAEPPRAPSAHRLRPAPPRHLPPAGVRPLGGRRAGTPRAQPRPRRRDRRGQRGRHGPRPPSPSAAWPRRLARRLAGQRAAGGVARWRARLAGGGPSPGPRRVRRQPPQPAPGPRRAAGVARRGAGGGHRGRPPGPVGFVAASCRRGARRSGSPPPGGGPDPEPRRPESRSACGSGCGRLRSTPGGGRSIPRRPAGHRSDR